MDCTPRIEFEKFGRTANLLAEIDAKRKSKPSTLFGKRFSDVLMIKDGVWS